MSQPLRISFILERHRFFGSAYTVYNAQIFLKRPTEMLRHSPFKSKTHWGHGRSKNPVHLCLVFIWPNNKGTGLKWEVSCITGSGCFAETYWRGHSTDLQFGANFGFYQAKGSVRFPAFPFMYTLLFSSPFVVVKKALLRAKCTCFGISRINSTNQGLDEMTAYHIHPCTSSNTAPMLIDNANKIANESFPRTCLFVKPSKITNLFRVEKVWCFRQDHCILRKRWSLTLWL